MLHFKKNIYALSLKKDQKFPLSRRETSKRNLKYPSRDTWQVYYDKSGWKIKYIIVSLKKNLIVRFDSTYF